VLLQVVALRFVTLCRLLGRVHHALVELIVVAVADRRLVPKVVVGVNYVRLVLHLFTVLNHAILPVAHLDVGADFILAVAGSEGHL